MKRKSEALIIFALLFISFLNWPVGLIWGNAPANELAGELWADPKLWEWFMTWITPSFSGELVQKKLVGEQYVNTGFYVDGNGIAHFPLGIVLEPMDSLDDLPSTPGSMIFLSSNYLAMCEGGINPDWYLCELTPQGEWPVGRTADVAVRGVGGVVLLADTRDWQIGG